MVGPQFKTRLIGFLSLATLIYYAGLYDQTRSRETRKFLSKVPANLSDLPAIDGDTCRCGDDDDDNEQPARKRRRHSASFLNISTADGRSALPSSTCSREATLRGPHQRVVSFSLYGTLTDAYGSGLRRNAELVGKLYPGWIMRVYHSLDTGDEGQRDDLCDLWCQFPNLDFCSVGRLPREANLGLVRKCNGMIWRFLVMGDPTVDRFIVRDVDSSIMEREVAAVSEWIASNRTWHFMHDNPAHFAPILGGMWGGMNRNLELNSRIRGSIIYGGKIEHRKGADQILLAKYLFQVAIRNDDYIDHSSFLCNIFMKSTPFPTRRSDDNDFVGSVGVPDAHTFFDSPTCPVECRPPGHLDWIYC